jgi:hypothetical protein
MPGSPARLPGQLARSRQSLTLANRDWLASSELEKCLILLKGVPVRPVYV